MKNIKKKICFVGLLAIAFSGLSILSSSCASSSSYYYGEPIGLYTYTKKKSNIVRSNVKVRDSRSRPNKKKRY